MNLLDIHGPQALIARTWDAERTETDSERSGRRGERYDDATAVLVRFTS